MVVGIALVLVLTFAFLPGFFTGETPDDRANRRLKKLSRVDESPPGWGVGWFDEPQSPLMKCLTELRAMPTATPDWRSACATGEELC